ncbi:MAG: hypothetical protein ACC682_15585 [Gemmatimonadota bacterium]
MTRHLTTRLGLAIAMVVGVGLSAPRLVAQDGTDSTDEVDGIDGGMRSTLEGVYTEEQADRGQELMWDICAECHFEEDYQGPFMQDWMGASVWGLFDSIWSTMPEDSPGGLPLTDYADAIAYMFRLNGLPAGDEELGTEQDVLDRIKIEWEP